MTGYHTTPLRTIFAENGSAVTGRANAKRWLYGNISARSLEKPPAISDCIPPCCGEKEGLELIPRGVLSYDKCCH